MVEQIQQELQAFIEPEKAEFLPKFFKTGAGEYAEGDVFLGVRVPWQRKVARKYFQHVGLEDIKALLSSPVHEYRSVALIILVHKYEKAKYEEEKEKEKIAQFYLDNLDHVNNWDLVDLSADKILGAYLFDKDRQPLLELAASQDLWCQRVAMIATFYFIRKGDFADTLALAFLYQ
jgi:3-methyladenine DNA glycosylase AlkD